MSQPFISYITRFKKIKKSILLLFSSLIIIDITFILRGQYKYTFFTNILLFVITNLSLSWATLLLGFPYKNLFLRSLARCPIFLLQIKYFPLKFFIMHLLFTMSFFFFCSTYGILPCVQPYFLSGSLRSCLLSFQTTYCHHLSIILK
jgi:hypothetical protein